MILFSCENMETIVDLDIPEHESLLVLNGVLDTDTTIKVLISHSVGAFSQLIPNSINDAEVLLFNDGIFMDTLRVNMSDTMSYYFNNGGLYESIQMHYYELDAIPNKNSTYTIEVNHNNYPSIAASTYIPEDIDIYNIDIDTLSNEDQIGFDFSFIDDGNTDNYYRLKLFASCTKEWEDEDGYIESISYNGQAWMMSNDPSFPNNNGFFNDGGYTFEGNQVVFSDALFNGEEKNIRLDLEAEIDGYKYQNCDTLQIQFSVFSSDTYSYYNSLGEHRDEGQLNIFGGEVIPVYSNVENGLGSLISTNAQIIQIKP